MFKTLHLEKTNILITNVPQWGKTYGRGKPHFIGQSKILLTILHPGGAQCCIGRFAMYFGVWGVDHIP